MSIETRDAGQLKAGSGFFKTYFCEKTSLGLIQIATAILVSL